MENNVALNLREIANKVNDEAEAKKLALHRELVEQKIVPHLQEVAENGKYQADFSVSGYSTFVVRDILRELGFTVDIRKFANTHYLFVKW